MPFVHENVKVELFPGTPPSIVYLSENDVGDTIVFELAYKGQPVNIPSGSIVKFKGTKKDGLGFTVNSSNVSGNVVSFVVSQDMTSCSGVVEAEISITLSNNKHGTCNVVLIVEKNPHSDGTQDGSYPQIISEMRALVNQIEGDAETASDAADTAVAAKNSAQEIQQDVHQYTASVIDDWLDNHPEATTTVQDSSLTYKKLINGTLGFVTPEMFGAVGDGTIDDSAALQAAINSGAKRVIGKGKYLLSSRVSINNLTNVTLDGLHIISMNGDVPTSSTIDIKGGSKNINIVNCVFDYGVSCIHLLDCSNIIIANNHFNETWYAIIQEGGYVSNDVSVIGNHATDLIRDFVECNCEINAPSKNWVISGNIYDRTTPTTEYFNEGRFVGVTAVENINISDNVIYNTRGNAIHCEDTGGAIIISNNTIIDSVGYDIDIDNGYKYTVISGNFIKNTLQKSRLTMINLPAGGETAGEYKIIIDGNMFYGNGTQDDPFFISSSKTYERQITNNRFTGFGTIFRNEEKPYGNQINNLNFSGNVVDCTNFINFIQDTTLVSTIKNSVFNNNRINGNIFLSDDGNGSRKPTNVMFNGNIINGNVTFNLCDVIIFNNNIIPSSYTLSVIDTNVCSRVGNVISGVKPAWEKIGQKSYACSAANTLENTGISFTVPAGHTWEVYATGTYSNSITQSYAITKGENVISNSDVTKFIDCGQKSPICICGEGTWYLYVSQASAGSNVYRVFARSSE